MKGRFFFRQTPDRRAYTDFAGLVFFLLNLAGCVAPTPTWGERTKHLNRTFAIEGRKGWELTYRDAGPADAPLTLLFVHGMAGSKVTWSNVAPALEHGYRVLLLDLLGHGDSSKPGDADYSMTAQAQLLEQFIRRQDLNNLVVVAESFGGSVALEALLSLSKSPDWKRIHGLVLIGATAFHYPRPARLDWLDSPFLSWLVETLNGSASAARLILSSSFFHDDRIPPELLAEYERVFRDPAARRVPIVAGRRLYQDLAERKQDGKRYAGLDCPTLLLWGEYDEVVPHVVMCKLAQTLPQTVCVILPDCGHTPPEECPAQTVMELRAFLKRVEKTTARAGAPRPAPHSP